MKKEWGLVILIFIQYVTYGQESYSFNTLEKLCDSISFDNNYSSVDTVYGIINFRTFRPINKSLIRNIIYYDSLSRPIKIHQKINKRRGLYYRIKYIRDIILISVLPLYSIKNDDGTDHEVAQDYHKWIFLTDYCSYAFTLDSKLFGHNQITEMYEIDDYLCTIKKYQISLSESGVGIDVIREYKYEYKSRKIVENVSTDYQIETFNGFNELKEKRRNEKYKKYKKYKYKYGPLWFNYKFRKNKNEMSLLIFDSWPSDFFLSSKCK